mgnify:CR=1 FL=1
MNSAAAWLSRARTRACQGGVPRVHLLSGEVDEGLLAEVFSNEGIGTLIYTNEYQAIRKARKKDVSSILNFIQGAVRSEELVKRTRATVLSQIQDYYVFEVDNNLLGCAALHTWSDQKTAEIACLCVKPSHQGQGIGRKLIQFLENQARRQGLTKLVALSSQAFIYFEQKAGFTTGSPDDLPAPRREKYEQSKRNSRILVKNISPI